MGLLKKWKQARKPEHDDDWSVVVIDDPKKPLVDQKVVWWVALRRMGKK